MSKYWNQWKSGEIYDYGDEREDEELEKSDYMEDEEFDEEERTG